MEQIILRFPHLVEQIFQKLNNECLAKCREGGRFWQTFIDERNYPWIRIVNIPTILRHGRMNVNVGVVVRLTYLHLAVQNGQIDMVEKIMKNSVELAIDLNARDYRGLTAFHHTCIFGKVKIAEMFINNHLDLKIDLNSKCRAGENSLHYACLHGQTKIAEILVKNSKDIKMELNSKNYFGITLFHCACSVNHFNIVEMMISKSDFYKFDYAAKGQLISK